MKKLILLSILAILCAQCGPKYTHITWWVENNTGQDIKVTPPPFSNMASTIPSDTRMSVYTELYDPRSDKQPDFEYFISKCWRSWPKDDVSFEVRSSAGYVRWDYWDKNLPGKQFFNHSSWVSTQSDRYGNTEKGDIVWTFKISPEDIQ